MEISMYHWTTQDIDFDMAFSPSQQIFEDHAIENLIGMLENLVNFISLRQEQMWLLYSLAYNSSLTTFTSLHEKEFLIRHYN